MRVDRCATLCSVGAVLREPRPGPLCARTEARDLRVVGRGLLHEGSRARLVATEPERAAEVIVALPERLGVERVRRGA